MLPIGNLMIEHRLIERMVSLMENQIKIIDEQKKTDQYFLTAAVNFFRYYADQNHHGKEEAILFQSLVNKNLSLEHKNLMNELISDHEHGRELVGRLELVRSQPPTKNLSETKDILNNLSKMYREHIGKEDKHFFLPVMQYFTPAEQNEMLEKFLEFDRKITQNIFKKIVENLEKEVNSDESYN